MSFKLKLVSGFAPASQSGQHDFEMPSGVTLPIWHSERPETAIAGLAARGVGQPTR